MTQTNWIRWQSTHGTFEVKPFEEIVVDSLSQLISHERENTTIKRDET